MATPTKSFLKIIALVTLVLLQAPVSAKDQEVQTYQRLLANYGRTVVTVSYVLSFDAAGGASDQRAQGETEATIVSADGLLLVPSAVLNPTDGTAKLAFGGVAPKPWRVETAERLANRGARAVTESALADARPTPQNAYKRQLTERMLASVFDEGGMRT